ncbi:Major Facilitator Superfamily protein [Thermoflavimicrobium dichotomicum]|uniref:Major Facilitator Superfamily protein n=1 Tax=Thermoflavimicrobium dichotomicum TaxID=46223 RepID=A0A1I3MRU1_9BACL|nr:Major Facilitator Superfamily protein [Thermoflavimicrobium dichotomicum]
MQAHIISVVIGRSILENFAIWVRNMAVLFYAMEQTQNDPKIVSLVNLVEYLPIFLFAFIGGAFADRLNPKNTIIICDILSILSIVGILFVIQYGWIYILIATFVSVILSQFSQPSSNVIIKGHLSPKNMNMVIGLNQSIPSIFLVIGPVIGTSLFLYLGIEACLILFGICFFISLLLAFLLPEIEKESANEKQHVWLDMKEGLFYLKNNSNINVIPFVYFFLALGIGLVQPLDVFLIMDRLQLQKESIE